MNTKVKGETIKSPDSNLSLKKKEEESTMKNSNATKNILKRVAQGDRSHNCRFVLLKEAKFKNQFFYRLLNQIDYAIFTSNVSILGNLRI